jgi:hypothetical protein
MADELDKEGEENASHDNGRGRGFIRKLSQAVIPKHELCVGVQLVAVRSCFISTAGESGMSYMNKGGRDDDTRAELLEHKEDLGQLGRPAALKQDGREDANGTCR